MRRKGEYPSGIADPDTFGVHDDNGTVMEFLLIGAEDLLSDNPLVGRGECLVLQGFRDRFLLGIDDAFFRKWK
jgi:hypothetical protein